MPWLLLISAGLLEIVWAAALKRSDGFTRLWPSLITIAAMLVSFALLAAAMRSLPLGVSYTVWVGIGAVGTLVVGFFAYDERLTPFQIACAAAIVLGVVGLRFAGVAEPAPPPAVDSAQKSS